MEVNAVLTAVLLGVRTRNRLVFFGVELTVTCKKMQEFDLQFLVIVSEGTERTVRTVFELVRMEGTVFGLEAQWVVELFHAVVGV